MSDSSVEDDLDSSYDHLSDETSDQNRSSSYDEEPTEQQEEKETVEFAEEARQIQLEIYAAVYEKQLDLSRFIYLMMGMLTPDFDQRMCAIGYGTSYLLFTSTVGNTLELRQSLQEHTILFRYRFHNAISYYICKFDAFSRWL